MALALEYTDNELPELTDVPKMAKIILCGETELLSSPSTTNEPELVSECGPKTCHTEQREINENAREIRKKRLEALSASVKKTRRVLTPRHDNPLLRPIGWKGDTPTRLPTATPKSRPRRNMRVVEENKVDLFADTDEGKEKSAAEEESDDESEGMSDFIVDDSESIEEDDSDIETGPPPPRSVKRFLKGRKLGTDKDEEREGLEIKMRTLDITDPDVKSRLEDSSENDTGSFREENSEVPPQIMDYGRSTKPARKAEVTKGTESETDSGMDKIFIQQSFLSENKDDELEEDTCFTTPPPSPKGLPRILTSPKKIQHIPATPHRPSMDGFWSQDVVNDWNDEYSPRKAPKTQPRPLVSLDQSLSDALSSPAKAKVNQAREERAAKAAWATGKDKFAQDFFLELDAKLSSGEISRLAKSTGGVKIVWNSRLKSSAGQAKWKRAQISRGTNELPPVYEHHATIELADKVVINEEQLLNTLAHEFCHLCTMMIDGVSDKPHGAVFKKWALACTRLFKARGVKVTTKHTYEIAYKFVWECTMCGTEYGRHSKSINPVQHRCSKCKGNLAQTKPAPRSAAASKPSIYQVFVKENMKKVRQENPGSPQKDIMRLLGQKYQEQKASNRQSQEPVVDTGMEVVTGDEGHGSADGSPNAASNDCLRKKLEDCCIIRSGE